MGTLLSTLRSSSTRHNHYLGIKRGIRPTALGKKNWLFIGHPDAGWRSAVIYSLIGSCKLAGVNPFNYFVWALNLLASATTSTVGRLLPTDFLSAVKEQP